MSHGVGVDRKRSHINSLGEGGEITEMCCWCWWVGGSGVATVCVGPHSQVENVHRG